MSLLTPVKYPVKYYSWQDANAPILTNEDGAFKTILKACLVTGYGNKEGAGWQMKFEDAFRMVLAMPIQFFSPPDLRIENGNDKHCICSLFNATGLEDEPLVRTSIVTKDIYNRNEWHIVVSDFGFWFYSRFNEGYSLDTHHIMYVGVLSSYRSEKPNYVIATSLAGVHQSGIGTIWMQGINDERGGSIINLMTGHGYKLHLLSLNVEELTKGFYVGQRCLVDNGDSLPIYACMNNNVIPNDIVSIITVADRKMLRTPQKYNMPGYGERVYYVPLDYWEL